MRRHHGAKSGVIIAACTALLFLLAALAGCGGTTTTTAAPEPSTTAPPASTTTSQGTVIRVDESSNGSVIHAQPGATLQVVLKGEPAAGYTWNLVPPQPQYLRTLPGPDISRDSNLEGAPATYTFSFLVMSIGESKVHANYVSSLGKTGVGQSHHQHAPHHYVDGAAHHHDGTPHHHHYQATPHHHDSTEHRLHR